MINLSTRLYGISFLIWGYIIFCIIVGLIIFFYFYRRKIQERYWRFRFPEKIIRVVIHYPNHIYKTVYRLIPIDDTFLIEGLTYYFNDKEIIKQNEFYARDEKIIVDGVSYKVDEALFIKRPHEKTPEIHYYFNNPNPIHFEFEKTSAEFNATQLKEFKESTLVTQLLTVEATKNMLIILIFMVVIVILECGFIIAKIMGWLDKK